MKIASWIPVTERLPEHPCFCAVLTNGDRTSTTWAFFALGVFLIYLPDPEDELTMIGMPSQGAVSHWFDPATLPVPEGWINTIDGLPLRDGPVLMRNNGFEVRGTFTKGEFRNEYGVNYLNPSQWKPFDSLQAILREECDRRDTEMPQ